MADRALESRERLVIVVNSVDPVAFRALISSARFDKVDECCLTIAVSVLRELELELCLCRVLLLKSRCLLGRLEREIRGGHVSGYRELTRPDVVSRVGTGRLRFLNSL